MRSLRFCLSVLPLKTFRFFSKKSLCEFYFSISTFKYVIIKIFKGKRRKRSLHCVATYSLILVAFPFASVKHQIDARVNQFSLISSDDFNVVIRYTALQHIRITGKNKKKTKKTIIHLFGKCINLALFNGMHVCVAPLAKLSTHTRTHTHTSLKFYSKLKT